MKLIFAQVGVSPCGQREVGKDLGLCSRAEQHNIDGLGREEGGRASQKGLLNRWGII